MHARSATRFGMRKVGPGAAVVVALTLVGAACSSSAGHSSSPNAASSATPASASRPTSTTSTSRSTTPKTSSTGGSRLSTFRSCMAEHGVSLPRRQSTNNTTPSSSGQREGTVGGGRFLQPPAGVDPTKYQSAFNACRSEVPGGGSSTNSGSSGLSADQPVVYKVSGTSRSASVVYSDSGGANDVQVSVPYQTTVRVASGAFFSVDAEGMDGATIGCEVLIDGKTIVQHMATTATIADCHGSTP